MGANCSCIRDKVPEREISIEESEKHIFGNKNKHNRIYIVNHLKEAEIPLIILLQSHIRGMLIRSKLNDSFIGSFFPSLPPDMTYSIAENPLITEEEVHNLLENYPSINDIIKTVIIKPIQYQDGSQYSGEFNQISNTRHGRGILKFKNGQIYYGQFKNDKANGRGKMLFNDKEEYEGEWSESKANGFGIYKTEQIKYEGKWINDRLDGIGTETWVNGFLYTGEYKNSRKNGRGKIKFPDGATYTGEFMNNKLHGKGEYLWVDGRSYNGDWKYSKIDGEGIFKWPNGMKYIGHYKNEKKNGYGIFEWADGKKYKGYWKNGKQDGEGEIYSKKHNEWKKGIWKNGKRENNENSLLSITKESK